MPFNFENTILSSGFGMMAWALDIYLQFESGFGSMRAMLPMRGLGAKKGPKTKSY